MQGEDLTTSQLSVEFPGSVVPALILLVYPTRGRNIVRERLWQELRGDHLDRDVDAAGFQWWCNPRQPSGGCAKRRDVIGDNVSLFCDIGRWETKGQRPDVRPKQAFE